MIAIRITHIVLHVTDDRVAPIGDVHCTVTTHLDIGRAKSRIARNKNGLDFFGGYLRTVVLHFMLENAQETDAITDQEVALVFFGEMTA